MSGISAQYADGLEFRIKELCEQVEKLTASEAYWKAESAAAWDKCEERRIENEKLTKERDESRKWAGAQAKLINKQEQQLAALAEQNKQLKAELKSIDGALNDPRANLTLTTSEIILELKEQVDVLTEAYDQCGRTVQDYGRTIDQTESRLREVAAHCANVEQQLAALAEQNAKMREAMLLARFDSLNMTLTDWGKLKEAAKLPDLATPALNRIRAEGMLEAEKIVRKRVQWVSNGQGIQYRSTAPESISAESLADEIRARAAELEKGEPT